MPTVSHIRAPDGAASQKPRSGRPCHSRRQIDRGTLRDSTPARAMKIALIYPPTCDPTAPYLAVPMLTGFLRGHGVEVLPVDANIEAYDALLRRTPLLAIRE